MFKITTLLCLVFPLMSGAQTSTEKQKILYGLCTRDSLTADPFGKWFNTGLENYHPNKEILSQLKKQNFSGISIQVFFGTWCGDSRRDVPRFLKLMKEVSFPENRISLIALGGGDSLLKQSPQHEETGKGIFRVPVFLVYKNGKEISRINEFPVNSLEKDLLAILVDDDYKPNYPSFSVLLRWMEDGTFSDENISAASLAGQLRSLVPTENELNSLGHLLLKQGNKKDALRIFQVNYYLYPESADIVSSLGEGYYETGDHKKAVTWLEKSLELNKKPTAIKGILEILYKAKEKEKS